MKRYVLVNADEMEPGTFKDRYLMEHDPHLLLDHHPPSTMVGLNPPLKTASSVS